MNFKRWRKWIFISVLGKMVVGIIVWVLGLVASVGIAYFFTDVEDLESLARKAGTVVMKELRENKEEVVETVQVLAKEYHTQNPEALKKFLFTHKDLTISIVNDAFFEYRQDVKEIMTNISPDAQRQAKEILNEIEKSSK